MTRNYVFDLYDTLLHIRTDETERGFWLRLARRYAAFGADYAPAELRSAYLRCCREAEAALQEQTGYALPELELGGVFLRLLRDGGGTVAPEDEADVIRSTALFFRLLSRREFCLWPGALELLARLRARGCRIFLLSNAQAVFTRHELRAAGLEGAFDAVYLSSDHGMRKPQPEFLQKLLTEQGLDPEETVMVGNDPAADMTVARACGVRGVLVNHPDGVPLALADRASV